MHGKTRCQGEKNERPLTCSRIWSHFIFSFGIKYSVCRRGLSSRFLTEIRWAQPFPRHSVRLSVDHRIKQWVQPRVTDLPTFPLLGLFCLNVTARHGDPSGYTFKPTKRRKGNSWIWHLCDALKGKFVRVPQRMPNNPTLGIFFLSNLKGGCLAFSPCGCTPSALHPASF